MIATGADIRKHDLDDLYERWHDTVRDLKIDWTAEGAQRSMKAFRAIMEYIHDGSTDERPPAVTLRVDPPRAPPGATP